RVLEHLLRRVTDPEVETAVEVEVDLEHAPAIVAHPAKRSVGATGQDLVALGLGLRAIERLVGRALARALDRPEAVAIEVELVVGCVQAHLRRRVALDPPDIARAVARASHRTTRIHHRRTVCEADGGQTYPERRDRGVDGLHGLRRGCNGRTIARD